jgi:hypothetical protein
MGAGGSAAPIGQLIEVCHSIVRVDNRRPGLPCTASKGCLAGGNNNSTASVRDLIVHGIERRALSGYISRFDYAI